MAAQKLSVQQYENIQKQRPQHQQQQMHTAH